MRFKMRRYIQAAYFCFLAIQAHLFAQDVPLEVELPTLSEEAEISLITVGPGQAIHSIFGHCALRVHDPKLGINAVYSYSAVITSKKRFFLESSTENRNGIYSRSTYDRYIEQHTLLGQEVRECILNLEQRQKQAFSDRLLNAYFREARFYPYHPFSKNCATLQLDLIISIIGEALFFEKGLYEKTDLSFFEHIQPYFPRHPWTAIGTNLALGIRTHRGLTYRERAFLPQLLEESLQNAFIQTPRGEEPLITEQRVVIEENPVSKTPLTPKPIWPLLAILGLTIYFTFNEAITGRYASQFDQLLMGSVSILGIVLVYTSIYIAHDYSALNLHLAWASPLHILALLLPAGLKRITRIYYRIYTFAFGLISAVFFFAIPDLFEQLWPLLLALLIRSTRIHSRSMTSGA